MSTKNRKIVFMGTPDFAVASLDGILEAGIEVAAVVTAVDKPAGRGKQLRESAVKVYAESKSIPVFQPPNLKDQKFQEDLKSLNADLFVVVAFRMLPESVWSMPELGTINLHASLLPQYRGAAPINWAIINGETLTGVSTFFIDKEIDTGEILNRAVIEISKEETAGQLHDRLMEIGAQTLVETITGIFNDDIEAKDQSEFPEFQAEMKPAPKFQKDDCRINWNSKGIRVYNFIRGLSPYPCAWTVLKRDDLEISFKIQSARILYRGSLKPGQIHTDNRKFLKVGCLNRDVEILELQMAGKKKMKTEEFLRGYNFNEDDSFLF